MEKIKGFDVRGRGFVLAVNSARLRGHAAPLALVRVQLRAVNSAGVARRLRAAFAGYLVTDDEAGYPFRSSRQRHQMRREGIMSTGFSVSLLGGDLDAPEYILAGSVVELLGGPFLSGVRRGEL